MRKRKAIQFDIHIGQDQHGNYYWFEAPRGHRLGDDPPPHVPMYGPFATEAECDQSQDEVLAPPGCKRVWTLLEDRRH